ncbi:cupin domain-containing protein [Pontibacterium granulatum]|uniref:cupin domain-containing protein n=1 Tax=Pontibacterium granulatum TaxID=2036029 RepID=UPI00249B15DE|nr:cupin domain-containing protein [Pontibacterium granulatum]MDI3324837.1 cupin domain-containing protein [Pontibacterium granulatum]
MTHALLRINPSAEAPAATAINPERVLSGAPKEIIENLFTNAKENFFCGVWSSTEGKWTLNYTEDEFCYLIRGKAILTDAQGVAEEINAGDAFVIPAGYQGTWETIGDAQKFYAIYEEA